MPVALDPKSLCETARSISKARMSMKRSALVLVHRQRRKLLEHHADGYDQRKRKRLTPQVKIENRYKLEVHQ
jgi:hypothetical protein